MVVLPVVVVDAVGVVVDAAAGVPADVTVAELPQALMSAPVNASPKSIVMDSLWVFINKISPYSGDCNR